MHNRFAFHAPHPKRKIAGFAVLFLALAAIPLHAQVRQYRGIWIDTFNSNLNNHNDVVIAVNNAVAAHANAIFAQVRRRGDSWYLNSLEPPPDSVPIAPGFDALQDLITVAHGNGIEVHAWVIVADIYSRNPTVFPPIPQHVFAQHGFNPVTRQFYTGRDNWLTKTLIRDGTAGITFNGQRFVSDFWIDLGHPDAEAYTVNVLIHLIENYDIDGLHFDRIRYPDISITGQTPSTGANVGYNETNLARFNAHYALPAVNVPAPGDLQWMQWRRDQVTNFVRRVYLNAIAIKPQMKISGALIVFGGINNPNNESSWNSAEAYWRVYQDWRAWTEEGILDIAMPMNYKREDVPPSTQATMFDQWNEWTRNHAYNRSTVIGQGAFLNGFEGSLRQVRRALQPSAVTGNSASGVSLYSMATPNPVTTVTKNPFTFPVPNLDTPPRPFSEWVSALVTGKSVNGTVLYEDPNAHPAPVFADFATPPDMLWKSNPTLGYLKGFVKDENSNFLDASAVTISRVNDGTSPTGRTSVQTQTDGGGFYGGVDLAPGNYTVTFAPVGASPYTTECTTQVRAGQVANFDVTIDRHSPQNSLSVDPASIWPPNHQLVAVTLSGTSTDVGTGLDQITIRVHDEYGQIEPVVGNVNGSGGTELSWTRSFELEAARDGDDHDGRTYTIEVTTTDRACNSTTSSIVVTVPHDQRNH
jgi:uncharacterized lipoprotein YddW (UPF0748 family)